MAAIRRRAQPRQLPSHNSISPHLCLEGISLHRTGRDAAATARGSGGLHDKLDSCNGVLSVSGGPGEGLARGTDPSRQPSGTNSRRHGGAGRGARNTERGGLADHGHVLRAKRGILCIIRHEVLAESWQQARHATRPRPPSDTLRATLRDTTSGYLPRLPPEAVPVSRAVWDQSAQIPMLRWHPPVGQREQTAPPCSSCPRAGHAPTRA